MARKLFRPSFLAKTDHRLESTNILLSAEEFIGVSLLLAIGVGVAVSVIGLILPFQLPIPIPLPILGPVISVVVFVALAYLVPYFLAQRRARDLEMELPDALRQMASTMRAGIGIDAAMDDIARSGYGVLSREFERAVVEVRRGRALERSLLALAQRSNSPLYERAFRLIVEGVEHGAALADVMDSVSKDAREVHTVQRERKSATVQQVLFLIMASVFAAPFISGLVLGVSGMFSALGSTVGQGAVEAASLPAGMGTVIMLYIMIQAVITAMAVGIIRYGQASKGLMFTVPFAVGALVVFYASQFMAGLIFPA